MNLPDKLGRTWKMIKEDWKRKKEWAQEQKKKEAYRSLVEEAKKDWECAISFFNHVADPELIDHAIFAMEAAEKKFVYLLKKARINT